MFDLRFPPALHALSEITLEDDFPEDIDLEFHKAFQSVEETKSWLLAWTNNSALTGSELRVFAQDGTGGMVCFWAMREEESVLDLPVVFMGSEGEVSVVASNFNELLLLLASGYGPYEANAYSPLGEKNPDVVMPDSLTQLLRERGLERRSAEAILDEAKAAYPGFEDLVAEWNKW